MKLAKVGLNDNDRMLKQDVHNVTSSHFAVAMDLTGFPFSTRLRGLKWLTILVARLSFEPAQQVLKLVPQLYHSSIYICRLARY
jgi:hypothetical protein